MDIIKKQTQFRKSTQVYFRSIPGNVHIYACACMIDCAITLYPPALQINYSIQAV